MTGKTISEKLLSEKSGRDVRAGDYVEAEVDVMMTHDVTGPLTFEVFEDVTGDDPELVDPDNTVITIDHHAPADGVEAANNHNIVREFADTYGAQQYDVGDGICHQVLVEGVRLPGRPGDRCGLALDHLRRRRRLRHRRRLHRPRDDARDRRAVVPGAGDAPVRGRRRPPRRRVREGPHPEVHRRRGVRRLHVQDRRVRRLGGRGAADPRAARPLEHGDRDGRKGRHRPAR